MGETSTKTWVKTFKGMDWVVLSIDPIKLKWSSWLINLTYEEFNLGPITYSEGVRTKERKYGFEVALLLLMWLAYWAHINY